MTIITKYRLYDNDIGGSNLLSLAIETLAIIGIVWIVLFLMPMYFGRGSAGNDDTFMKFLLDFYNHPDKYYPTISIIAAGLAVYYILRQLRPLKIIAIDVYADTIEFTVTNRLHRKMIKKNIVLKDIKILTKQIDAGIISYVKFYDKLKFIGIAAFSESSHRYEDEFRFLQKIKEMGVTLRAN